MSRFRRACRLLVACLAVGSALVSNAPPSHGQTEVVAQLNRIADDVYVFSMTRYNAMFIVTDDGVIATDPIGLARSSLYKAAIASVTDRPVRYVVYSHDHNDHIGGGSVFADTAQFVSHSLAVPKIIARADPDTPVPTVVFQDHLTLELGGKSVDLHYMGPSHSDNNLLLVYPAAGIAFGADFIEAETVFTGRMSPWLAEWVEGYRWIEDNLDFDILVAGHGGLGTKDTFRQARQYFESLVEAVRGARISGFEDDSEEMVAEVRAALAPRFGAWINFDARLPANVAAVIRNLDAR